MPLVKFNKDNFLSAKASDKAVLVDFYADWCGPCRMVSPIVDEIAQEHPEFLVGKVNVDDSPELAKEFSVVSIPTLVILKGGKELDRIVGARPKSDILDRLNKAK